MAPDRHNAIVPFQYNDTEYSLSHGSVVIAAITSCTNTSNPSVMLGAGECICNPCFCFNIQSRVPSACGISGVSWKLEKCMPDGESENVKMILTISNKGSKIPVSEG